MLHADFCLFICPASSLPGDCFFFSLEITGMKHDFTPEKMGNIPGKVCFLTWPVILSSLSNSIKSPLAVSLMSFSPSTAVKWTGAEAKWPPNLDMNSTFDLKKDFLLKQILRVRLSLVLHKTGCVYYRINIQYVTWYWKYFSSLIHLLHTDKAIKEHQLEL